VGTGVISVGGLPACEIDYH